MSQIDSRFRMALVLGAATLAAAGSARAEEDESGLQFHLEQFDLGALFTDVDSNSSKYEEYRDRREGVIVPGLALSGQTKDGKHVFELLGRDITRDDGRWTLGLAKPGCVALNIDFNQIVHRFGNDGTLLHGYTAPGVYSLSDSLQAANQA